jgi:ferrous-iron efflux pump FieF
VSDIVHGIERGELTKRAAIASMAMALTLVILKSWASWSTGSVAMLGSLADNVLDLIASFITFLGVRWAAMPADEDHRFGHGKAEALAALIQVILITISALGIAWRAIDRFSIGQPTEGLELGVGVSIFAMAATLALLAYQRHVIRRTGSIAISTDNLHYKSDIVLNLSVIVALVLDQLFGWRLADPIFGLGIAMWLLFGAWRAAFLAATKDYPELAGLHDFRTRHSGAHRFVQFHVWVPPHWTVREAHDRLDSVEEQLQVRFPGTEILIHVDPEGQVDRETLLPSELTEQAP